MQRLWGKRESRGFEELKNRAMVWARAPSEAGGSPGARTRGYVKNLGIDPNSNGSHRCFKQEDVMITWLNLLLWGPAGQETRHLQKPRPATIP
jgi:hypothetical protein